MKKKTIFAWNFCKFLCSKKKDSEKDWPLVGMLLVCVSRIEDVLNQIVNYEMVIYLEDFDQFSNWVHFESLYECKYIALKS